MPYHRFEVKSYFINLYTILVYDLTEGAGILVPQYGLIPIQIKITEAYHWRSRLNILHL
jgi:hypothetical protein